MRGILFIVSTPIGNLRDISIRAIDVLKEVDLILCEDTRVTKKLLERFGIRTETRSYHQHSKLKKTEEIVQLLKRGKNLALVSDAGTPGISDPGNKLVAKLVEDSPQQAKIVPLPGPSALSAAASVSGFPMDKFLFLGFPPTKKKREKFFKEVIGSKYSVVFYESPYRIIKSLTELRTLSKQLPIVVCRELTKKFETIYRGTAEEVLEQIKEGEIRGEFVVIVRGK